MTATIDGWGLSTGPRAKQRLSFRGIGLLIRRPGFKRKVVSAAGDAQGDLCVSKREIEENACYGAKGGKVGVWNEGLRGGKKKFVETKFEDEK